MEQWPIAEPTQLQLWLMYAMDVSVPLSMTLAILLLFGGTALVVWQKRPGAYWMLAGALTFIVAFIYYVFGPGFETTLGFPGSRLARVIAELAPIFPLLLFSIGFVRLAWSLRGGTTEASNGSSR